jgi:exosortase/archaeosortase family protein
MTLGTMALFLLDFLRLSRLRGILFMALVVPIALGANAVRLALTAGVAAIGGPEAAESFLHDLSGLVVFVTGVLAMIICGKVLEWTARRRK